MMFTDSIAHVSRFQMLHVLLGVVLLFFVRSNDGSGEETDFESVCLFNVQYIKYSIWICCVVIWRRLKKITSLVVQRGRKCRFF